jgi:hypothetical protein
MKKRLFTLALLTCIGLQSIALAEENDTIDSRRHEAERYLQAAPPKEMFADMAEKMAVNVPPPEREKFKQTLTSELNVTAISRAMLEGLVRYFTTEELRALADFYGSPVGKSAMKKFPSYMADLMPTIEREITRAQTKVNKAQASPSATATPTPH